MLISWTQKHYYARISEMDSGQDTEERQREEDKFHLFCSFSWEPAQFFPEELLTQRHYLVSIDFPIV